MRTRNLLALSSIIWIVSVGGVGAQPVTGADVEARRAEKRAATEVFLDRSAAQALRLAAVKRMGYPEDATMPALQRIAADTRESDAIRLAAFGFLQYGHGYLNAALNVLDDPNDGGAELDAGLIKDIMRRITFRLPEHDQQRIVRSFRKLLTDRRAKVRLFAFRALVANHDSVALGTLTDTLRRGSGIPIPLSEAIDLLDQDGPQNYVAVLRPYLSSSDPKVQARAARALSVDPDSRARIVGLANSRNSAEEVRLNALRGLAREDPRFGSYAIAIVANSEDSPAVRYAAMHEFVGRMNYNSVPAEDQIRFVLTVEAVAGEQTLLATATGRKTSAAAKELLPYLKKTFPPIKTFYENR